ncbi:MAG: ATPase domain-containing protein [Candidatus Micrarchaeaceae archaeon]
MDENLNITKRIKTGISGIDKITDGGIPINHQVIVMGNSGSGKTLLSLEILYHNAKLEIPSTFITTEEVSKSLIDNVANAFYEFEDFEDFINAGTIQIIKQDVNEKFGARENFEKFISSILDSVSKNNSKILVFDSLSSLRTAFDDDRVYTRSTTYMTDVFRDAKLTSFITMELENTEDLLKGGLFSTSMFDGVISLKLKHELGNSQYEITVPKLRNSGHRITSFPYQITSKGFDILIN